MRKLFKFLIPILFYLIACEALENSLTEKKPPEVSPIQSDAGFEVDPGDTVKFSVNATNPEEGALSYDWSAQAGTFIGSTHESSSTWKAPGSGGNYWIKVDVSNTDKTTSQQENIIVRSRLNPYVNIITPSNGDYLVQHTSVKIDFEAIHNNGIAEVHVYINDVKIDSLVGHSQDEYQYTWDADAPAGETKIKIKAISKITDKAGADSVTVSIEGILPGNTGV